MSLSPARLVLPLLLLAGLLFDSAARAETSERVAPEVELEQWRLENGMRVLFAPHRRIPAVTVQVWYHVGSKNEWPGVRGVAHMFEHMMFKGSKRVRPERHAQLLNALGGNVNAFTSEDVTAYHNTLPAQYLDFAVKLEAERMRNLLLTERTIESEREVVKEEKRLRLENSPLGRAFEAVHDLAYEKHPYSWTPAGDIPDLNRVTKAICQRFFETYYRPGNATLIVVGDVDESAVRAAADRHFGPIPGRSKPPRVSIVEPPQQEQRRLRADWPAQRNVLIGAYHIPAAKHEDMPALTVASYILSAGRSSRLHQALVRRHRAAVYAGGEVGRYEHPGLFFVYAIGLPVHSLGRMEELLLAEIGKLASGGSVTDAELSKARNQLATDHLERLETVNGVAYQIGSSTYLRDDPRAFLSDVERLEQVTAADIRRVAATYLRPDNLSLVLVAAQDASTPTREQEDG